MDSMITKTTKQSAKFKSEIEKAFKFFEKELGIELACIEIRLTAKGFWRKTINGYCQKLSDSVYLIALRPLELKIMLLYLAHEMVHVEQHHSKKMQGNSWLGEDHSNTEYFNQPWEIDARDRARILVQKYLTTQI